MTVLTEISWRSPKRLLNLLHAQQNAVFLDSGGEPTQQRARWSFLCPSPEAVFKVQQAKPSEFWPALRHFRDMHRPVNAHIPSTDNSLPFTGGLVGMISYEAGLACEGLTSRHDCAAPFLLVMACTNLYIIDRQEQRLYWASNDGVPPPLTSESWTTSSCPSCTLSPDQSRHEWEDNVRKIQEFIASGDIFQANLTMRWTAWRPPDLSLLALYQNLRRTSPAPFGAFLTTPDFSLLSASVERFLSLSTERWIETRPIKGTAPLTTEPHHLAQDTKERAENIMITDLMRHDIGRVCTLGSVTVPQLCATERFTHMHHLVSTISGHLKKGLDAVDLLAATIPPGSVTGAPKHRALEIIDKLETSARGAYCGTLFRLGWDGAMDSAVIIRSLSATTTHLHLGAGGGITYPSDPTREYHEMHLKAAPLLTLLEKP